MSSADTHTDLQSTKARYAELEKRISELQRIISDQNQKLIEPQDKLKDRESLIFNKEVQIQKLMPRWFTALPLTRYGQTNRC